MSVTLISNSQAIAPNLTVPFLGTGGTPPYTYSMMTNVSGGSVDASTGVYTSGPNYGTDVVKVTDATANTATLPIMVLTYMELLCEIIQNQLGLQPGRVWIFDQKINEPKDFDLYIVLQVLSCKPFANTSETLVVGSDLQSVQSTNFQATIQIDVKSRGIAALNRKEEVIMALGSDYAERQQELNSFNISLISNSFTNLSEVDGAAIPYRFNISVMLQYSIQKNQNAEYYDDFSRLELLKDDGTDVSPSIDPEFILLEDGEEIEI